MTREARWLPPSNSYELSDGQFNLAVKGVKPTAAIVQTSRTYLRLCMRSPYHEGTLSLKYERPSLPH